MDYVELHTLAEAVQNTKALANVASTKFIRTHIFSWAKRRFAGTARETMISSLIAHLETVVSNQEVWIPITHLYLQSPVTVGHVNFRTMDAALFDTWVADARANENVATEGRTKVLEWIESGRIKFQGTAAAVVAFVAEPERARELALDLAQTAVGVFRLFAQANYRANASSVCDVFGQAHIDSCYWFLMNGQHLIQSTDQVITDPSAFWVVPDHELR